VAGLGRRWWQRGGQQGSRQAGKSVRLSRRVRGGQTEVAEKVLGDALRRRLLAGLLVLVGQWRVGGAPSPNPLPRGEGEDLFATLRGRGWCACGRCRPWRLGGGTGRRCRRSASASGGFPWTSGRGIGAGEETRSQSCGCVMGAQREPSSPIYVTRSSERGLERVMSQIAVGVWWGRCCSGSRWSSHCAP
jgi:hypothetical protein